MYKEKRVAIGELKLEYCKEAFLDPSEIIYIYRNYPINCPHRERQTNKLENLFNEDCSKYGIPFSFVDNSTIMLDANRCNSERVAEKLDMILNTIETFLTRNNQKLNEDKTVIMRITNLVP